MIFLGWKNCRLFDFCPQSFQVWLRGWYRNSGGGRVFVRSFGAKADEIDFS